MKKISFFLLVICLMGSACKKEPKNEQDLISSNLSKSGKNDPTLLIGEWDCVKFAYTSDGNKILDVITISKASLKIPIVPTPVESNRNEQWMLSCVNSIWYRCSISDNMMELVFCGSTYVNISPSHEENNISFALENAYSFVIKDNELILYFTGIEDKNLLILKKR